MRERRRLRQGALADLRGEATERRTSLCWKSLVTPKKSWVASCVENVSPQYNR